MMQSPNVNNQQDSLDLKHYFSKLVGYWQLFVVTIAIGFLVAKFVNGYQEKVYSLSTVISVKKESNSLFSTGTNLTFNWGGASHLIETTKVILNSRTHNEKVVSALQYYTDYLVDGQYRLLDVYGSTPFKIHADTSSFQLYETLIKVTLLTDDKVNISFNLEEDIEYKIVRYADNHIKPLQFDSNTFSQNYTIDQEIISPYFSFKLSPVKEINWNVGSYYYIRFKSFQETVSNYRKMKISEITNGASLLEIKLQGHNKNRIAEYLNTSVRIFEEEKIAQKTLFARKTQEYINNLFEQESKNLNAIEEDLGNYKIKNSIYDLSLEGQNLFEATVILDKENRKIKDGLTYLENLKKYLTKNNEYSGEVPVPAVITIDDSKIPAAINELIVKSSLKESLKDIVKESHPQIQRINQEIGLIKSNLLENITSLRSNYKKLLEQNKERLRDYNKKLKNLPAKEQGLISFERNYKYSEANYNFLKQKSFEAGTAIQASVSDVKVIDTAIALNQKPIYPKPMFNYLVALMLGTILPLFYIIIAELLDNKVKSIEDVEKRYSIPILGAVGRNLATNNLAVYEKPKSMVAESFRALRSNIQFLFKTETSKRSKTLLVTSSVSGEGKTMVSINMATVFAMGGKKTILVGLDLRKPRIYDDFELTNEIGAVNYFIAQNTLDDIVIKTHVENLDVILSGPIPPNPSELLLSDRCTEMIETLKKQYDYIIIDSPPVALVSDSLELFKFSDAILYIIRQNYSELGMMKMIDEKYKNKEVANISYVINDYSINSRYGYGYEDSYGYGRYGYGYHENEKKKRGFIYKFIRFFIPKKRRNS